jgi:K+-sensing histidine kinase KdpD
MGLEQKQTAGQIVDQVINLNNLLNQFARLIEISVAINTNVDHDSLLQAIIAIASDILECEAASILLYDDFSSSLMFYASVVTKYSKLKNVPIPLDKSIARQIFTEKKAIILQDFQSDPKRFDEIELISNQTPKILIGVPMRIKDKVIGVLEGINKLDGQFTQDDIDILLVVASQAATAMQNAQLMNSLKKAYEELSAIDKIRSTIISIASHELRTPLTRMMGYAHFIQEDSKGQVCQNADKVVTAALKMRTIQAAMINMDLLESEIGKFITIVKSYKDISQETTHKKQKMIFYLPKNPIYIKADSEMLEKSTINILRNSSQFSPINGQKNIKVKLKKNVVSLLIQDSGPGILDDELSLVFGKFYQIESRLTRVQQGLGLGLSISKEIITQHSGKIWSTNKTNGREAIFHIKLPVYQVPI